MRLLHLLVLLPPLAMAPGCVVAGGVSPASGYGYGYGYGHTPRPYAYAPPPRHWGARPYHAPPPYFPPRHQYGPRPDHAPPHVYWHRPRAQWDDRPPRWGDHRRW